MAVLVELLNRVVRGMFPVCGGKCRLPIGQKQS
jgi:hypothetical protein